MKLLILGGTRFVGRHLVDSALTAGHEVTLFNRGQSNPGLYAEVETIQGNRDGGLGALKGRRWDAVIDTCGYVPRIVRASAELLADAVDHYTFISSISVYADHSQPGLTEMSTVAKLADESVETVDGGTYGGLKALCEQAAEAAMPGRVLNIRPGLIVGPYDHTDRFTYWPVRIARGGNVLAAAADQPVQVIDVRDLADWTVRMTAAGKTGIYNATGPNETLTMQQVLETCRLETNSDATLTWVDDPFCQERQVGYWAELPLALPPTSRGTMAISVAKAVADGLTFRPLHETVRDTLAWQAGRPADTKLRAGLAPEREAELLREWQAR